MDELIKKVMQDISIDEHFIENPASYRIIKSFIRIKLKDLYAYYIYLESKDEKKYMDQNTLEQLKEENERARYVKDIIDTTEISMKSYYTEKMKNPEEWQEILERIKNNSKILEKIVRISADTNKLFITYKCPWEKQNIVMFYNEYNGNIDVKKTREEPIEDSEEEKEKVLFCRTDITYNSEGKAISADVKHSGSKMSKEHARSQVTKLRRKYYDDIFQKLELLKNKGVAIAKNVFDAIINAATVTLEVEEEEKDSSHDNSQNNIK